MRKIFRPYFCLILHQQKEKRYRLIFVQYHQRFACLDPVEIAYQIALDVV
ncbi:hypothetical protein M1N44_01020 [Dehalococcoidia bacterium]|nr:hypothetical protein [Dehalococcoidia bacterium]MCL0070347.1 hypothetical protein [Dehalococcoidia bacterium]